MIARIEGDGTPTVLDMLGTHVLQSIATLQARAVLRGQAEPSRASRRRRFPKVEFYGEESLFGGLPGHRHQRPELSNVLDGRLNQIIGSAVYEARRGDWLVFAPNVAHGECCLRTHRPYELLGFMIEDDCLGLNLTRYTSSAGYEILTTHRLDPLPGYLRADVDALCSRQCRSLTVSRHRLLRLVVWCMDQLSLPTAKALSTNPHPLVEEVKRQ